MLVNGNILIVDQNGTGDYITIQEGINNATTGDTVLVYPGNYIEIVDFSGKNIVVASLYLTTQDTSYISQTIIDGNQENYQLVRFTNGETEDARLIGFTITNASGPFGKSDRLNSIGLGIHINESSPVIESNRIINNSYNDAYIRGGGIAIENSSARITGNTIQNNEMAYHGGGIYISNSTNIHIENNSIQNNITFCGYGVSYGAGIYIDSSNNILLHNNNISENDFHNLGNGGGISMWVCNHIKILNNTISNNGDNCREGGGIYAVLSSNISIIGNLLYNNQAEYHGAGLYCESSEISIINNTICFNQAIDPYGKGGGIACNNSSPIIQNTILFFNSATLGDQVFLDINSDPNFFYSNIEGGLSAFGLGDTVVYNGSYENNIGLDPHFILSGDHPYNLDITSPCINTGNPDTIGLFIPEVDLVGNSRIVKDTIDIGAYEYQFPTNISYSNETENINIFPNPTSDKITIHIPEIQLQKGWITINDIDGKNVLKIPIEKTINEFDLSHLPSGIYIVKITYGNSIKTGKIILL